MFEEAFQGSLSLFIDDEQERHRLLASMKLAYSAKNRHYHNLLHLENLLKELEQVSQRINNWNLTILCIAYHDLVYNSKRSDNEERSAAKFETDLHQHLEPALIRQGVEMILATKGHIETLDNDTNYFTDADLSILGASAERYKEYSKQIREEYSIYPDFLYKNGRRQVLKHFLNMNAIYKTEHFKEKYESSARRNMQNELEQL